MSPGRSVLIPTFDVPPTAAAASTALAADEVTPVGFDEEGDAHLTFSVRKMNL